MIKKVKEIKLAVIGLGYVGLPLSVEFAKKQALMQFQQYGMMEVPEEYLTNYAKQMLENKDEARKIWDRKVDDKVVDYIKNTIKVEDKEVSTEEFNKMFE